MERVRAEKALPLRREAMRGEPASGFKDRDLYVLCADGTIRTSPTSNGANLKDFASGQEVMQTANEGQI
jgi:hypothetical protein